MANLIEALKSGKAFRACFHGTLYKPYNGVLDMHFTAAEILSEYQIEEEKIEITKAQLAEAWDNKLSESLRYTSLSTIFFDFCAELGFKP